MKIVLNITCLLIIGLINSYHVYNQSFDWVNITGGDGVDVGEKISIDNNGNTYSTGYYSGIVDFDPSLETLYLGSSSQSNGNYLRKLNSNGQLQWVYAFDNNNRTIYTMEIDNNDNVVIIGAFKGVIDFDPTSEEFILESGFYSNQYNWNIYIQKIDPSGNLIWAKGLIGSNFIYNVI